MSAKILDRLISAFVGAVSAVGTVWFLNSNAPDAPSAKSVGEHVKFDRLEVDALRVNEVLLVADPETKEPTIKLSAGSISAQNNVFAEQIGAFRVLGQKLQATPYDPLDAQSAIFAELATNQDGGAYLALLSPQETHSVTIGFDKTEKGCLVSQNNEDSSMIAQAIFPKPTANQAAKAASTAETPLEKPQDVAPTAEEPALPVDDELPPFDAQDVAPTVEAPALPAEELPPLDAQDAAPLPAPVPGV